MIEPAMYIGIGLLLASLLALVLIPLVHDWSAPHLVDAGQAARLTIRRACSCSNLAGLRYPSAEWSRLLL